MSVAEFRDDSQAYLSWVAAHPDGFVINIQRSLNPGDARLHRASCYTIRGEPPRGQFVGQYIKICSESETDLTGWALRSVGAVQDCGTCRPGGRMDPSGRSSADRVGPYVREGMARPARREDAGSSAGPVVMTNRDRVDRGMGHLASALNPFVSKRMTAAFPGGGDWLAILAARNPSRYGGGHRYSLTDPRFLLRVVTEEWRAFKDHLSRVEQGFATELKDAGNRWAHGDQFSADDTYRTLDTMERLLTAIGAAEQASEIRSLRLDLQRPAIEAAPSADTHAARPVPPAAEL